MKVTSKSASHAHAAGHTAGGAKVKQPVSPAHHSKHAAKKGKGKKPHHKAAGKRTSTPKHGGFASAGAAAAGIINKPTAEDQLVQQVASRLLSGGFAAEIIAAVEAVVQSQRDSDPGRLLAGTISNLAGAIQTPAGGEPYQAMVFLHGSTAAVPAVVPTYLIHDIAPGQEVWVVSVNGRRDDLMIHSIRVFTGNNKLNSDGGSVSTNGAGQMTLTGTPLSLTASSAGIELGNPSVANTPFIDFHSSGAPRDYDVRLIASSGSGVADGQGALQIYASSTNVGNNINMDNGSTDTPAIVALDSVHGTYGYMDMAGETLRFVTNFRGGGEAVSAVINAASGVMGIGTDDNGAKRMIQIFVGTTDPAGRAGVTVNEGDLWINV